ncbi:MAG: carboxypeptidase regulatory-like domain-containing protein [Myxococcales bacterium]|nr:carboxypeptidase regulatory-like domain-containing protein [Myxococcales bacterium]
MAVRIYWGRWVLGLCCALVASGCSGDDAADGGPGADAPIVVPGDLKGATVKGFVYVAGATLLVPDPSAAPAGATPAGGVPIRVVNLRNEEVASATTAADGAFSFENLPNGLLTVEVPALAPSPPAATAEVTAFPNVTIEVNRTYAVSRDDASAAVLAQVPASARVVRSLQPLPAGTIVYPAQGKLGPTAPALSDALEVSADSWFFFVDLHPHAGFAHPVEYVLVDASTGAVTTEGGLHWPPVLNYGALWSSGETLYRFTNFDFAQQSDLAYAPANATATPTAELAQAPPFPDQTPLPPDLDQFLSHNTDPASIFLIVWQASPEGYRVHDSSKIIDKFVNAGVNYQSNVRWIRWQADPGKGVEPNQGKVRYLAALAELNQRIDERLAIGQHSTLVVYVTSHAGPGAFASYRDEARQTWSWVYPEHLQLTTTKACRVRALFEFCFARAFANDLASQFQALPPGQRHDTVLYSAAGADEFSYAVPTELSILSGFNVDAGGRFTSDVAEHASVSGGDLTGLLDASGTEIRDDMKWLFGTIDITNPNLVQRPNAIVAPANPAWCEAASVSFLEVEPAQLAFAHTVGQTSCPQSIDSFSIQHASGAAMEWTATSSSPAIEISPESGSIAPGMGAQVAVTFNCSIAASFESTITVQATDSANQQTSAAVTVKATIGN